MPTYEYECKICGYTFEVFQSMKDDPLSECPECGKEIRRLINGGSGIIFKGSGFYSTDKNKSAASSKPEGKTPPKPADTPAASAGTAPSTGSPSSAAPSCASCPASASGSCPASGSTAG